VTAPRSRAGLKLRRRRPNLAGMTPSRARAAEPHPPGRAPTRPQTLRERVLRRGLALLPQGLPLPDRHWNRRHRGILTLLWAHAAGLSAFAVLQGFDPFHSIAETSLIAATALVAAQRRLPRHARAAAASLGLVVSSALLVHFWQGTIEAHFHFFFIVAVLALYQSWIPFLLGIVFVVVHHGLVGSLASAAVYNHADAVAQPWHWALIHGAFVVATSAACLTTWRLSEELLQEVDERRAESRNISILESAGEGIYGLDPAGRITFVNSAASALTGYPVHELVGRRPHALIHHTRADGTPHPDADCTTCAGVAGRRLESGPDEVYFRKDGTSFPVEFTMSPIVEGGEITGSVVVFRDVSERREVERLKDEFTSVVSHELRTPLTSIRGSLGLLAGGALGELPAKGRRMLEIAVANTDRLVRLINDILDIEKIDSGRVAMEPRACAAHELVQQAAEIMQQAAVAAEVRLTASADAGDVMADPDRVVQTLTNLISNAVKFSPPGTGVAVRAERQGDDVLFSVADRGRGIPAENLDAIFERFQQVDSSDSREKGGTGLGLAICRSIVNQHGGRIWAESELGQGSTFHFTLQAVDGEAPAATASRSGGPRVLVCDDDASVREVVAAVLEQRGYHTLAAGSAERALELALAETPDVILVDLVLPGMSGSELSAALREHPQTRNIPLVVLSAVSEGESRPWPNAPVQWVEKPVDEAALFEALDRALRQHPGNVQRVLVAEDEPDLAECLLAMFERNGVEAHLARTGREAITLSQRVQPELLVLDLGLPEGDGFEVVNWLRHHDRLASIPLVVYTARDLDDGQRARLRLAPDTIYLTKSRVSPEQFETRVMGVLERLAGRQLETIG